MPADISYTTELPIAQEYFVLYNSTGWNLKSNYTKEQIFNSIQNSYYTVSAYDGIKLVGFGRIISDGILHAFICEMIVHPEYQGMGIGKHILEMLLKKCNDDKIKDIQLFCAKGKKEFYEKMGFVTRDPDAPGMQYDKTKIKTN